MFTTVGWFENIDTAVIDYITALQDPHIRVVGDDIIVPGDVNGLMGCIGLGASMTQIQLMSPSLRERANLDLAPVNVAAEPAHYGYDTVLHDWFDRPIPLVPAEAINARINQAAGAAEDETVLIWLGTGMDPVPTGPMFTLRCTNATTLAADAWTNGALTLTQSLPAGRYALVGARARSAGLIAARFVFPGYQWRPGIIGVDAVGDSDFTRFRYGNAGMFGEFEHDLPPTVDFLSVSADTAQVVHLDLIQTRAGRA